MTDVRRLAAELLGTYILVLGGTTAVVAATASEAMTSIVPIAFAFGLALLAGLYAFGEVSGGHFNPAVTLAMLINKKVDVSTTIGYWIVQVVGGVLASFTLMIVSSQEAVASTATTLAPGIEVWEGFLIEMVFTAIFLLVILKATSSDLSATTAFLGIGLTLTMIHLCLIPFTGTSVNPARSLGPAIVGNVWTDQWLYIVAPLVGGALGWIIYRFVSSNDTADA